MASSHQLPFNPAPYFRPMPSSLKIGDEINRGSYGSVSCGELDGTPVAVKRLHGLLLVAAKGQGDFKLVMSSFQQECQLLEQVDHPHVVKFRGAFYDDRRGEPVLVMDPGFGFQPLHMVSRTSYGVASRWRHVDSCLDLCGFY